MPLQTLAFPAGPYARKKSAKTYRSGLTNQHQTLAAHDHADRLCCEPSWEARTTAHSTALFIVLPFLPDGQTDAVDRVGIPVGYPEGHSAVGILPIAVCRPAHGERGRETLRMLHIFPLINYVPL